MKKKFKKNLTFLLWFAVFCILIPNLALTVLRTEKAADIFAPVEIASYTQFLVLQWTPFWAAYLAYRRQLRYGDFSVLPALGYVLAGTLFMIRTDFVTTAVRGLTIGLLLVPECFAFLKKLPKKGFWGGIRASRKLLKCFFFWEITTLCIIHIANVGTQGIAVPLILIPLPAILIVSSFKQLNEKPVRFGGVLCLLFMMAVTAYLCTFGPMVPFRIYFLLIMLGGYAGFFLLQLIYHADRWTRKKEK